MKTSAAVILAVGIVLGCVYIGVLLRPGSCHAHGQPGEPPPGRYQLVSGTSSQGGFVFFYLLDTATGGCWVRTETAHAGVASVDPQAHRWAAIPPKFAAQRKGK